MTETRSIPEMLGFPPIEKRYRALSQIGYQAQYLLYEDEAEALLREFAPDEDSAKTAHPYINNALSVRYIHDQEYRDRVDGGYPAMQAKMEAAGVIPAEEKAAVDTLNRLFGNDR